MHFERYALTQGWPVENYAMCLETLLTGKALEVYSRIPLTLTNDFEHRIPVESFSDDMRRFQAKDLSVFLRENATKDLLSLSDMATKYTLARTGVKRENKP